MFPKKTGRRLDPFMSFGSTFTLKKENIMLKKLKLLSAGLALSAATLFSASTFATTTLTNYPWYGTPYAYTSVYSCTWTWTTGYGGSWGSQFLYVSTGACPFKNMQVNHSSGATTATVVLN